MLADPRSNALVKNFAAQWLYLRNLDSQKPDNRLFPDFDDNLRQAFRRETEMLFESVMNEDRSVLDLLRADYTFLNERLAKHYGIPNVYGSHFRRVDLGRDHVRGGLLGQGSIMTVTSYANRTSPVQARQVDSREPARDARPAAAGERAAAPGEQPGCEGAERARADGRAPQESGVRELPPVDGSGGSGDRELRCDRTLAHAERSGHAG